MTSKVFSSGVVIDSAWLNDVNNATYNKLSGFISDKSYGTVGDGVTEDTAALQAALNASSGTAHLFLGPNTYVTGPLSIPNNTVIHFHPKTILKAKTGLVDGQRLINISSVSNVTIHGNGGKIQMLKAEYVSGEQRHGVMIYDASNVNIYNLFSNDSGGDGFYVGGATYSSNVNLICCGGDNNRRQGLSVVSCDGFMDFCGTWTNTNGTAPEAGIDIEPNNSAGRLNDIRIINPRTSGNAGSGILAAISNIGATAEARISIDIIGHRSYSDGSNTANPAAARFVTNNISTLPFKIDGRVSYSDFTIEDPDKAGIGISYWDSTKAPFLDIHDGCITNAGFSAPAANRDKSAISVFGGTGSLVASIGNFRLNNIKIKDSRGAVGTYTGVYLENIVTTYFDNFEVIDVVPDGFTPTVGSHIVQLGYQTNSLIKYSRENKYSMTGSATVTHFSGRTIVPTGSMVATLQSAAAVLGQEYIFRLDAAATFQIRPYAGDTILQYGLAADNDLIMNASGDYVKLRAVGTTTWQVEAITDKAKRPEGYNMPGTVVWKNAAPTTGTWAVGDRCINNVPIVGQPKAWACTVAGTPGTWVSEGNL